MKKRIAVFSLFGVIGALLVGVLFKNSDVVSKAQAEESTPILASEKVVLPEDAKTHIVIDEAIPSLPEGTRYFEKDDVYWSAWSYGALEKFYSGEEANHESVSTITWKQYTRYVIFQWGAANDAKDVGIRVHYLTLDGAVIDTVETIKNNTFSQNGMVLRYHSVCDEVWNNYSQTGFQMYFELYDYVPGWPDYAYHLFGYLKPNQTLDDVRIEINNHYFKTIPLDNRNYENGKKDQIRNHYIHNGLLNSALNAVVENFQEDFEDINDFYKYWNFEYTFGSYDLNALHFDKVIRNDSYRPHNTNMPFNKDGNAFFSGWYEDKDGLNQGFVGSDVPIYRFVSPATVISETNHYVSIKMAGTASLHILDTQINELAFIDYRVHRYEGYGDPDQLIHLGFNTCTMANYVINLSAFAGKTVRFAIADIANVEDSGWATAYFDSLVVNYDISNGFRVDDVVQTAGETTYYSEFNDIYVSSLNNQHGDGIDYKDDGQYQITEDNSHAKAAYDFVRDYYALARNRDNGTSMCAVINSQEMTDLLNRYVNLSSEAKIIVDNSDDYHHEESDDANWYLRPYLSLNLGEQIRYIASYTGFGLGQPSLFKNMLNLNSDSSLIFIPVTIVSLVILLITITSIKKRKQTNSK